MYGHGDRASHLPGLSMRKLQKLYVAQTLVQYPYGTIVRIAVSIFFPRPIEAWAVVMLRDTG